MRKISNYRGGQTRPLEKARFRLRGTSCLVRRGGKQPGSDAATKSQKAQEKENGGEEVESSSGEITPSSSGVQNEKPCEGGIVQSVLISGEWGFHA